MKKLLCFVTLAALVLPVKAVLKPIEIDPEATACRIAYRRVIKKIEYRHKGGQWTQTPLMKKSPVESARWRGYIKNLKPSTEYEVRLTTPGGDHITDSFVTQPAIPEKVLKFIPTFENCSFEIPDHEGKGCQAEYRTQNGAWKKSVPAVWMPDERCWRGAFPELNENTVYEVRARVSGKTLTGKFRTRCSKFPVVKTVVIDKLPFKIESGKPGAYIRYTAKKTLKGTLKLDRVKYVILDGITLDGNRQHVGLHLNFCQDVAVTNCKFFNCSVDSVRSWENRIFGQYCYKNRKRMRNLYGSCTIRITASSDILIERCLLYRPNGGSNSWQFSHPSGPEGIVMDCARSGVVVRYNDFAARDEGRWNDCIASIGNGCPDGGFGSNADIYGNYFSLSNDDACELEGCGRNLRFYRNRIEQTFSGISTGRCSYGPVYIFRNLLVNAGDEQGHFSNSLKNGMQAQGKGTIFFLHNTIAASHGGLSWIFGNYHRAKPIIPLPALKGFSRGNVFVSRQDLFPRNFFQWPGDYDFDVINQGAASFKEFLRKHGQEKNAVWGNIRFTDPAKGNYFLTEKSSGRDLNAAPYLSGIKHAGACQEKDPHALLGRKHFITSDAASLSTAGNEVVFTVSAKKDTPFNVVCNDDFYTVKPMKGILKAGVPQKFTVSCINKLTPFSRIYRGVFFIRRNDGLSLPLGFAFDRRKNPVAGHEIPNGGTINVTRTQAYFVYVKGLAWAGEALIEVNDQKISTRISPFKRRETDIVRFIDKKTRRAVRLILKPGRYTFKVTGNKRSRMQVQSLIISALPDKIFNGALQEEF